MQEFLEFVLPLLIDFPEEMVLTRHTSGKRTTFHLKVRQTDVGKVIGKQGRTARSVRTILGAVSMKLHHRYTLDILEEDDA